MGVHLIPNLQCHLVSVDVCECVYVRVSHPLPLQLTPYFSPRPFPFPQAWESRSWVQTNSRHVAVQPSLESDLACVCVCVCVCARARARARVCVLDSVGL